MMSVLSLILAADKDPSSAAETIVLAVLSSSVVGGVIQLATKKTRSPESENDRARTENDLARIGGEFAHQMLQEARTERQELRLTIHELESTAVDSERAIARLKALLEEKNAKIHELETIQIELSQKLQRGEPITLNDIFGNKIPDGVQSPHRQDEPV